MHFSLPVRYFKQSRSSKQATLPETIMRWGIYRFKGEKDVVRMAFGAENRSDDQIRDSSFVRVQLLVDPNARDHNLLDDPQPEIRYGRLLYIFHAVLPHSEDLGLDEDCEALLGMVRWCKGAVGDASRQPVWYQEEGELQTVNMATIQCTIGHVKRGKDWVILDPSCGCARVAFVEDEDAVDVENVVRTG